MEPYKHENTSYMWLWILPCINKAVFPFFLKKIAYSNKGSWKELESSFLTELWEECGWADYSGFFFFL